MEDIQHIKNRIKDIIIEFGDGETNFHTRDITRLHTQLTIEQEQNEVLVNELAECETSNILLTNQNEEFKSRIVVDENELERCEVLLNESLEALKWMFKNMQVTDSNLQSDAFNIPANAIDQLEKHLEIFKNL